MSLQHIVLSDNMSAQDVREPLSRHACSLGNEKHGQRAMVMKVSDLIAAVDYDYIETIELRNTDASPRGNNSHWMYVSESNDWGEVESYQTIRGGPELAELPPGLSASGAELDSEPRALTRGYEHV